MELFMAGAELSQVLERTVRRRSGLNLHQFNVLRAIAARDPDPTYATDLSRALSISAAHATTVLQRLEQKGLVTRSESPVDRRRRVIRLTQLGEDALAAAVPALEELERGVAASLGPDSEASELRAELRSIRLALRHVLVAEDWEHCVGP
jgi:DNA-binding MarR family transcriptional regulator